MRSFKWSSIMNGLIITTSLLFVTLMMASPVLAHSESWYFYQGLNGRVVDGSVNGIIRNLPAGVLTISGEVWTTNIAPGPTGVQPHTIEVHKKKLIGSDKICAPKIYPPANDIGQRHAVSFSKDCGTIEASSEYYLYIWRTVIDGREVEGSGTLEVR
ncbi:MAG: hypothetical protein GFH27_549431n40 [Chloroflexi bacterium AL-W]|nr:hypothetical protein [Chloroflexi bacterium AL-N1]NOK71644.1 hypothetical protein [Chloroflexi bacterium AL-N10]NOK78944.1 hypothetical protein [Chloroflexi bacterium AL-N5]NOK86419.1 hypothetical protein [Chloroflexi bacterium AL-W]